MSTKTQMYDVPREVWLDRGGYPSSFNLIGETSHSWLSGIMRNPYRWPKSDYRLIPEAEALEMRWAVEYRGRISNRILFVKDPAILRQIAALIGYREGA